MAETGVAHAKETDKTKPILAVGETEEGEETGVTKRTQLPDFPILLLNRKRVAPNDPEQ
jgi:hypothetical protein